MKRIKSERWDFWFNPKVKSSLKEIDDLKVEIKKLKAKDEVSKATKKPKMQWRNTKKLKQI